MDNDSVQLIGGPCGQHGPYTFYKGFKYTKDGIKRIMTLSEFFFVKLWMDSDLVCIGELQLLWIDKNSEQVLTSLRLYFLPENTPEGRMDHGEDEVLAISEKVVLRVEDLVTWITLDTEWTWGRLGKTCLKSSSEDDIGHFFLFPESSLDFSDIEKEKRTLDICNNKGPAVLILSYPRYCRYRSVMKRLEGVEDLFLRHKLVNALGGFGVPSCNTRILFCRDTFDYPELEGHELLCNHLAPKLKGRPRGKRKKRSLSPGSESNESECSIPVVASTSKMPSEDCINEFRKDCGVISTRRSTRCIDSAESKVFLKKLTSFMKTNHTPIGRIPSLGYKELDLYVFYAKVQKYGGYEVVTMNRLWKSIFDDLGGNHGSTSAATVMRRHYERFLLPYERHLKGEDHKPLPASERRRLKSKINRNSVSDAETNESTSGSDNSTSVPRSTSPAGCQPVFITICGRTECKDNSDKLKTSSLRSVRVKPERIREAERLKLVGNEAAVQNNNVPLKIESNEEIEITKLAGFAERKENEPNTTALTPVQKVPVDETLNPIESKEIPATNIKEEEEEKSIEIIEIPPKREVSCKDIIELDSTNAYKTINSVSNNDKAGETIREVKKRKLDILKQGGLEVTPVRSITNSIKELRPSVIQTAAINRTKVIFNGNIEDTKQMPPPQIETLSKRSAQPQSTASIPTSSRLPTYCSKTFSYNNQSPPKVLQSKSIYSPSGETIYGDPKDVIQPSMQAPKCIESTHQTTGGLLDLTIKSSRKPTTKVTQVPPCHIQNSSLIISAPLSLLDSRKVGSNLEITLVGANNIRIPRNTSNSFTKHYHNKHSPKHRQICNFSLLDSQDHKIAQKKSYSENYSNSKLPKVADKIRSTIYSTQMYHPQEVRKNDFEITHKQYKTEGASVRMPLPQTTAKQPYVSPPTLFNMPNYMNSFPKGMPHFMHMDPSLYYLQSMYSPLNLPPMSLMPPSDSLQLYTEIFAQNPRSYMPFPFSEDSVSISSNNTIEK